jgi:release factor glutamine methyltransferase
MLPNSQEALYHALIDRLNPVSHSVAQARAEARLLLGSIAGLTFETILTHPHAPVADAVLARLQQVLARRLQDRLPVQYLLAQAPFDDLVLHVSPSVLIPRPETELLVERAAALCQARGYTRVLDVGTGSGAIALALKHRLGDAVQVTATDISPPALAVARENGRRLNLAITWRLGDVYDAVPGERFDLIVSNPPYIDEALWTGLMPEVRLHEPKLALVAADHGFAVYHQLVAGLPEYLTPGGALAVEVGDKMATPLQEAWARLGTVTIYPDYAGMDRVVVVLPATEQSGE